MTSMNPYKSMVLLGILFSVVLIISNMVNPTQAFVIIGTFKTYTLAMVCIITGVILGVGIHGMISNKEDNSGDDTFGF